MNNGVFMDQEEENYWENIKRFPEFAVTNDVKAFIQALKRGEIVQSFDPKMAQDLNTLSYIMANRKYVGCMTPTLDLANAIKEIIKDGIVLEVGAGTGLLAKYLDAVGINIIATDNYEYHNHNSFLKETFFPVENLDFKDAIKKYKADYLLLSWALYNDPLARDAAKLFTELNPNGLIIYIGEFWGCTGDDEFHENIEEINDMKEVNKYYVQWMGFHDEVYLVKWVGK